MDKTKVEQHEFDINLALTNKDKDAVMKHLDEVIADVLKNDIQVTAWASSIDVFSGLKLKFTDAFGIDARSMRVATRVAMQKQRAALFMKTLRAAVQRTLQAK